MVTDGFAIYDTMRYVLLAGGAKGMRFALSNTRKLHEMLANHTGQLTEKIELDTELEPEREGPKTSQ